MHIRTRRQILKLLLASGIAAFILFLLFTTSAKLVEVHEYFSNSSLEINEPACVIPFIEPDFSLNRSVTGKIKCSKCNPPNPVFISDDGFLVVDDETVKCSYRNVVREGDFAVTLGNESRSLSFGKTPCPGDVFIVACSNSYGATFFEMAFRCINQKPETMSRIHAIKKPTSSGSLKKGVFDEKLNILIFGLDSVSRVGWLEQMSQTADVMENLLEATTFEGYNIVGDGTTAAILGLTTGYLEEELPLARRGVVSATTLDNFPFIWRQLAEEAGYVTLIDEDCAWCATLNYRLKGFASPPVDHYGRPFQLTLEKNFSRDDECLGSISRFEEMLSLFWRLFTAYPDPIKKYAQVVNQRYTHNFGGAIPTDVDKMVASELIRFQRLNYLNNSVLILFSDHGPRFDKARATQRGKIAERLPYLSIALPAWFRAKYPKEFGNLKRAARQLTTPFDLHATLLDLTGLNANQGTPTRGKSFFRPIPKDRTCKEAGVEPHWCTCLVASDNVPNLPFNHPLILKSTDAFEKFVNQEVLLQFIKNDQCEPITVEHVFSAKLMTLNHQVTFFKKTILEGQVPVFFDDQKEVMKRQRFNYIHISFWTSPGDARWEITAEHEIATDKILISPKQISRTNRYETAPACIADEFPHLREFCVCKQSFITK